MTFRKAVGKLHLWLGLASGLIVLIVSLSGAVFVFQDEIRDLTQPWRHVAAQAGPVLPPSRLQAAAQAAQPGAAVSYTMYMGPQRSVLVYLSRPGSEPFVACLDPYTGRVLHVQDPRTDFFTLVQELHMYLLLPPAVGKWVVDGAVIIFVTMLVSGLVLWWPRNKAARKQRFAVKWDASPKRRNYDLHAVVGFYASALALVLALTGLCISYPWLMNGFSTLANGGRTSAAEAAPRVDTLRTARPSQPVADVLYARLRQHSPQAEMLLIGAVGKAADPVYATAYGQALHYYHRDEYQFHPRTGQLLLAQPHASKNRGQKLADMNYDLHTGLILGLGGKVIAFVVSLLSASMPVTGFLIWRGRHKPKKPVQRPALAAV